MGRPTGDSGRAGGELTPERSEILEPRQGRGVAAPALLLEPYSPECVEGEFSELPLVRIIGSSRRPSAFGIMFLLIAQRIDPTSKPAQEGGSQ